MRGKKQKGFTIIELMVAITVAAILLSAALPSFRTAIQNSRLTSQANEMLTAFQLARSEALKRGTATLVCASSDEATFSGTWEDGWIVAVDGGDVIRVWGEVRGELSISDAEASYRYLPRGILDGNASTVTLAAPGAAQGRVLEIARSGSASIRKS